MAPYAPMRPGHLVGPDGRQMTVQVLSGFFTEPKLMQTGLAPRGKLVLSVSILILVLVAATAFYAAPSPRSPSQQCDTRLADKIGAGSSGLCLQPLVVTQNSNSSEFYVPVLVIQPGASGTLDILYDLTSGIFVSHPGLKPNLTASDLPIALSVATGASNATGVGFSNASLIFKNNDWVVYRYTIETAADSSGYYAILPRYYWGMRPALAVGTAPGNLNLTALAMWGYTKCCISGEIIMNSTIVGAAGFTVANVTVPGIEFCPNAACNIVARSHY